MTDLQNISEYCLKCRYRVPENFQSGSISLDMARRTCANCKFGKVGIYKFDIVYTLFRTVKAAPVPVRPKGKKSTYVKRYGVAVERLRSEGKTVRQIAEILGISPTSVIKITKQLQGKSNQA